MKLGHIDYLNCYPFYYHLLEKQPLKDVEIISDYPAVLNGLIAEGKLDMSPISAATYADICEDVLLLPDFCLSSVGYVGSVILISKIPIEDLSGKKIGITRASHTSVILLKILLKMYYDHDPEYTPVPPRPSLGPIDAALVIGNDAMVKTGTPAPYIYDLGDLWLRKTGFPVVFAVFVVRKKIESKYKSRIREVISSYHASLACLQTEKNNLTEKARQRYPDIIYDMDNYYDLLKFEFTDDMKKALMFYYGIAADLKLLKRVDKLRFLEM